MESPNTDGKEVAMNKDVELLTKRVIKTNVELQDIMLKVIRELQLTLDSTYKDNSTYREYLNDYDKDVLKTFYSACYDVLRVTTNTITELNESEDN